MKNILTFFCSLLLLVFMGTQPTSKAANCADVSQGKDEIVLSVVLQNGQTELNEALSRAVKKYWTCTKYEFIDTKVMGEKCTSGGYYLVLAAAPDENSLNFGYISILTKTALTVLNSDSRSLNPLYVRTNKKTGVDEIYFDSSVVGIGIRNLKLVPGPEFYIALMNQIFDLKFVKKMKKRCFDGPNETPEGIFFFDGYSSDYLKDKTLLIDEQTAGKMLKKFDNEANLKRIISKTTLIPEANIFIKTTSDLCESFLNEYEDVLYLYTYYCYLETELKGNIGELWMAPNIINSNGKFVASLDKYANLKKKHK
ncbi:MAG: hypothetical protein WCM76_15830 [Bacteroidota bacterium]